MRGVYNLEAKREFAAQMRRLPTAAEATLWYRLRKKQTGFKFHRQSLQRGYILDFYCPRVKLAIEVDGSVHDLPAQAEADAKKEQVLTDCGIKVLRFSNQDVLEFMAVVMVRINAALKALSPCPVVGRRTIPLVVDSSCSGLSANSSQPLESKNPWAGLKAVLGIHQNLCRPLEIPDDQRLTRESAEEIVGACKKLLRFDRQRSMEFDNRTNVEKAFEQKYHLQEWLKKNPRPIPPDDEAALALKGMHVTERKA